MCQQCWDRNYELFHGKKPETPTSQQDGEELEPVINDLLAKEDPTMTARWDAYRDRTALAERNRHIAEMSPEKREEAEAVAAVDDAKARLDQVRFGCSGCARERIGDKIRAILASKYAEAILEIKNSGLMEKGGRIEDIIGHLIDVSADGAMTFGLTVSEYLALVGAAVNGAAYGKNRQSVQKLIHKLSQIFKSADLAVAEVPHP